MTRTRIAVRNLPRDWTDNAIRLIQADARRSADTHLLRYPLPSAWAGDADVALYLKDETTHVTGSLKHRLARSLFLYALCNGWIGEGTTVVEASSGSTAVSEAYFAALLGLPFVAVMPESTSAAKVALIESQGGRCHFVADSSQVYAEAERVARQTGGHYLDQFTNAERATDWRGNNNIAESIFEQMRDEKHPVPAWIVVGAGTGGTSATIGRYIRYRRHATRLCVVDPEHSAFFAAYAEGRDDVVASRSSRIEGIGRPRVEPSFLPGVVDRMVAVPDAASVAAARHVSAVLGRRVGAPQGEVPLRRALIFPVCDLALHSWDIHRCLGRQVELPPDLLALCQGLVESLPEEMLRRPGAFGPAQPAPENSSATARLMAFLGRSVEPPS
ncbi:pyridoxal-phosphate dependent enzyme [Mycobacterium avium]|uniref:pyridoxal-phosphate dependent enzyme n=11 Tax=Mycobacterium avium TaxID=1764 RepID=UPI0009C11118|nr:pyridoxal-phosphate dependent enzyme [Mycobacterium avium]